MCDQDKALAAGVALLERAIDYALGSLRVITPAALCRPTPCTGWNLQHLLDHMADSLQTLNDAASGHIPPPPRQTPFIPCCSCACGVVASASGGGEVGSGFRGSVAPVSGGVGGSRCSCSCACGAAESAPGGGEVGSGLCRSAALASGGVDGLSSCSGIRRSAVSALLLRDRATEVLGVWVGALNHSGMVSIGDRHLTAPMVAAAGAIEIAVHGWDVARACGEQHPIPALMAEELLDLAHLFVTEVDRPRRFAQPRTLPSRSSAQDYLLAYLGRDPNWPTAL